MGGGGSGDWVGRIRWWLKDLFDSRKVPIIYSRWEVLLARLTLIFFIQSRIKTCPLNLSQTYRNGLNKVLGPDFQLFFTVCSQSNVTFSRLVIVFFGLLWAMNRFPVVSSFIVFFISLAYGTAWNSSGSIAHITQLTTMIMGAQFLIHLRFALARLRSGTSYSTSSGSSSSSSVLRIDGVDEDSYSMNLAQQVTAGSYFVSALMKTIRTNGLWILKTPNFVISLITLNERLYYSDGSTPDTLATRYLVPFLLQYPMVAVLFFSPGWIFEIGFPIVLWGDRRVHFFGGLAVWIMHTFIYWVMGLSFECFKLAVLAFFMNLPYWIVYLFTTFRNRNGPAVSSSTNSGPLGELPVSEEKIHSPAATLRGRALSVYRAVPCKAMIALVIVCYLCKDNYYPFSNFPMYSLPKPMADYTYVTGYVQHPNGTKVNTTLTCQRWFKKTCSQLLKFTNMVCRNTYTGYDVDDQDLNQLTFCGNQSLYHAMQIMKSPQKEEQVLQLDTVEFHYVRVFLDHNWKIQRREYVLAEYYPKKNGLPKSSSTIPSPASLGKKSAKHEQSDEDTGEGGEGQDEGEAHEDEQEIDDNEGAKR